MQATKETYNALQWNDQEIWLRWPLYGDLFWAKTEKETAMWRPGPGR